MSDNEEKMDLIEKIGMLLGEEGLTERARLSLIDTISELSSDVDPIELNERYFEVSLDVSWNCPICGEENLYSSKSLEYNIGDYCSSCDIKVEIESK